MDFFNKNNLAFGLVCGILVPIIGYGILEGLFSLLSMLVNEGYGKWSMRTISLLAICFNLIPFNFYKNKKYVQSMRGVILPTVIFAVVWAVIHRDYIFPSV